MVGRGTGLGGVLLQTAESYDAGAPLPCRGATLATPRSAEAPWAGTGTNQWTELPEIGAPRLYAVGVGCTYA